MNDVANATDYFDAAVDGLDLGWPPFPYPTLFRSPLGARRPPEAGPATGTGPPRGQARRPGHPPGHPWVRPAPGHPPEQRLDRKSTRLNSSHLVTSYAVFCLKKKKIMM